MTSVVAWAAPTRYTYYDPTTPPSVATVEPEWAFAAHPTALMLHGANFVPVPFLECNFGSVVVPATFLSSEQIACTTPVWPSERPHRVRLCVSSFGNPGDECHSFAFFDT